MWITIFISPAIFWCLTLNTTFLKSWILVKTCHFFIANSPIFPFALVDILTTTFCVHAQNSYCFWYFFMLFLNIHLPCSPWSPPGCRPHRSLFRCFRRRTRQCWICSRQCVVIVFQATCEAEVQRVLREKAAADRRAAECAAEAIQLRGERDRLKVYGSWSSFNPFPTCNCMLWVCNSFIHLFSLEGNTHIACHFPSQYFQRNFTNYQIFLDIFSVWALSHITSNSSFLMHRLYLLIPFSPNIMNSIHASCHLGCVCLWRLASRQTKRPKCGGWWRRAWRRREL